MAFDSLYPCQGFQISISNNAPLCSICCGISSESCVASSLYPELCLYILYLVSHLGGGSSLGAVVLAVRRHVKVALHFTLCSSSQAAAVKMWKMQLVANESKALGCFERKTLITCFLGLFVLQQEGKSMHDDAIIVMQSLCASVGQYITSFIYLYKGDVLWHRTLLSGPLLLIDLITSSFFQMQILIWSVLKDSVDLLVLT